MLLFSFFLLGKKKNCELRMFSFDIVADYVGKFLNIADFPGFSVVEVKSCRIYTTCNCATAAHLKKSNQ